MSLAQALLRSAAFSSVIFLIFWPLLTWWLHRWHRRHLWQGLYQLGGSVARRRLMLLGGLWALLPSAYSFTFMLLALRS